MNTKLVIVLLFLVKSYSCIELPIVSGVVDEVLKVSENLLDGGDPDAHRTPCQLIESRNFICDEHFVTTVDNYILSIQHIINPVLIANNKKTIKPLVIQHGILGSATHWLINSEGGFADDWTGDVINANLTTEGRNAPYLLANLGYDVWMSNFRGCKYSRNHTYLNPDTDAEFWKFSYEHMIKYDVPTIIDYVLNKTGQSKLGWIGHSMGTTALFGLLSEQPEYSAKIKPFIALAPVAHVGHITSPLKSLADTLVLKEGLSETGGEIALPQWIPDLIEDNICVLLNETCASILQVLGGFDPEQLNSTRLSTYFEAGFCGGSVWTLVHFGYNIFKDQFAKFDFGLEGNMNKYGSPDPPQYNLSAINSENIILFTAESDSLSDAVDVMTLKNALTVPYIEYKVSSPKFAHLDFLWAANVYSQAYKPMIQFLQDFN